MNHDIGSGVASVDEAVAFIARFPHVCLLGRRADGYPTGYPMTARAHDGVVDFSTYRASAKVENLERDGVAAVLAVSEEDDRVLWAAGTVSLHRGDTGRTDDDGGGIEPTSNLLPEVPEDVVATVSRRHASGKRCVLRVTLREASFSARLVSTRLV